MTYQKRYTAFQSAILADKKHKTFCKAIYLAAKRQQADLKKAKKKSYPYVFNFEYAQHLLDFIETLPYVEGRFETENIELYSYQIWCLSIMFGWRHRTDQYRKRFNQTLLLVGRKQGKSTLSAALALYCLLCEGEKSPLVLCCASSLNQTKKVFTPARQMIKNCTALRKAFHLRVYEEHIKCDDNGGHFHLLTSAAHHQDGHSPHLAICDEGHQLDNNLYNVLRSADGIRENYLLLMISTAGITFDGACWNLIKTCRAILKSEAEIETTAAFIFELDEKDELSNTSCWVKANPMLIDDCKAANTLKEKLQVMFAEAQTNPTLMFEFERKRMNRWGGDDVCYYSRPKWEELTSTLIPTAEEIDYTILGADLASVRDTTALIAMHILKNGLLYVESRFFVPKKAVDNFKEIGHARYDEWIKSGHLIQAGNQITDYAYIEKQIMQWMDNYTIDKLAIDPWNAQQLQTNLIHKGVPTYEVRQGAITLNSAAKRLTSLIHDKQIRHDGNEVFNWQIGNVVMRVDVNDNVTPCKQKSSSKIDGPVALINALAILEDSPRYLQASNEDLQSLAADVY